ncbi:DUF6049 family protein [Nocardioides sp.]|uniref:DUF6049 family protein n=1 Tax=Nocardioides sp. TaxID=35761 RepID=UPI00286C6FF4|nr:DUF6049 family protein [Nocardioides sp.]
MVRSPLFRRALGAAIRSLPLLACLSVGVAPASAAPAAPAPAPIRTLEPLSIELTTVSPSVVPREGPIRITGTITNIDIETWSTINLYPFVGDQPMTTSDELAEAAKVPVDQEVGGRITDSGPFDTVEELEPGESYFFTITVPRSSIPLDRRGVYWFGVHALGEGPVPRDAVADGRARTFLPYVPANVEGSVETGIVIPLRRYIAHEADGAIANTDDWARTLEDGGRMRGLVDLGAAAGDQPVTWLIDPALLDAVRRLAAGNPARSLSPTQPADPDDPDLTPSTSPSATISPADPDEQPTDDATDEPSDLLDPEAAALAETASTWLADLEESVADDQVLTLPYGDLDVAASAQHDPALYELAVSRTSALLEAWGVSTTPGIGSPSGYMDAAGIDMATPDSTILVTDRMFGDDPPAVAESDGHRLVVTSTGAASGGPLPGERLSAIGLRQRLLSEAAVRVLEDDDQPLVMMLPVQWNPEDVNVFFDGLAPTWLDLSPVSDATARVAAPVDATELTYPDRQAERELDERSFAAVEGLVTAGEKLQNLLTRNDQVASVVTEQALSSASYAAREAPRSARQAVVASRTWIDARLGSVQVDAPPGVTLSGASGNFAPTLTNALDEPVTVVVTARTDAGIVVSDSEEIQLAADSQTTILLRARTLRLGVHSVTLYVTDTDGRRLGSSDQLPIRSGQVSTIIWVVLASGAGILLLAIGVRLVRRFRRRHEPPEADPGEAT